MFSFLPARQWRTMSQIVCTCLQRRVVHPLATIPAGEVTSDVTCASAPSQSLLNDVAADLAKTKVQTQKVTFVSGMFYLLSLGKCTLRFFPVVLAHLCAYMYVSSMCFLEYVPKELTF